MIFKKLFTKFLSKLNSYAKGVFGRRKEIGRKEVEWEEIGRKCIFHRSIWLKGKENNFPLFAWKSERKEIVNVAK